MKPRGPFVDRIEGDTAVLVSGGREQRVAISKLPKGAREGVYLTPDLSAIDEEATREARDEAAEIRDRLKRGDDGGDISL